MRRKRIIIIIIIIALVLTIGSIIFLKKGEYAFKGNSSTSESLPTVDVEKITDSSNELIPLAMNEDTLTNAVLGWNTETNSTNTGFQKKQACKDKEGNILCVIYTIRITNNSSENKDFSIGLTSLESASKPNIDAVLVSSNGIVPKAESIKNTNDGILSNVTLAGGSSSELIHLMVFVRKEENMSNGPGTFNGIITINKGKKSEFDVSFSSN